MEIEELSSAPCLLVLINVSDNLTRLITADEISARLDYLRRNSSLDAKTGLFYLPPPVNEAALHEFFRMYPPSRSTQLT